MQPITSGYLACLSRRTHLGRRHLGPHRSSQSSHRTENQRRIAARVSPADAAAPPERFTMAWNQRSLWPEYALTGNRDTETTPAQVGLEGHAEMTIERDALVLGRPARAA